MPVAAAAAFVHHHPQRPIHPIGAIRDDENDGCCRRAACFHSRRPVRGRSSHSQRWRGTCLLCDQRHPHVRPLGSHTAARQGAQHARDERAQNGWCRRSTQTCANFFLVVYSKLSNLTTVYRGSYTDTEHPCPTAVARKPHNRRLGPLPPGLYTGRAQICPSATARAQDHVRQSRRLVRAHSKVSPLTRPPLPTDGVVCFARADGALTS